MINISRTDDVRPVLAHEIQHAIQAMEGFARGSNPGEFKNTAENVILDIVRALTEGFWRAAVLTTRRTAFSPR